MSHTTEVITNNENKRLSKDEDTVRTYFEELKETVQQYTTSYTGFKFHKDSFFIYSLISIQCNVFATIKFSNYVYSNIAITHIIPFTVLYICVGIPLQMCQMYLGQYTQLGTIRIWRISPIFIGVGLSMVIATVLNAVVGTTEGSISLLYMKYSTYEKLPYVACESYPNESVNERCYNSSSEVPKNFTCLWPKSLRYPADYYFWKYIMVPYEDLKDLEGTFENSYDKSEWMVAAAITWILVSLCVIQGYEAVMKIVPFQIGNHVLVMVTGLYFIFKEKATPGLKSFFRLDVDYLMTLKNWDVALENVIMVQGVQTGLLILYGSFSKLRSKPGVDTCIISGSWYILNVYYCLLLYVNVGILAEAYKVPTECIYIREWISVYGVVPQLLVQSNISLKLMNLMFCVFVMLLVVPHSTLLILSVVENLKNAVPAFRQYHPYLAATVCSSCFIISSPYFLQHAAYANEIFTRAEGLCCVVITLFFSVAVFWIYGIQRLCDDIHFTTGYEPTRYWKFCWKTVSWFYPAFAIYYVCDSFYDNFMKTNIVQVWKFLILLIVISPIIILAVYQLIEAAWRHDGKRLFRASKTIGLTSDELRRARRHYNPRKEIRHRTHILKCKHNCLIHSKVLHRMMEFSEHRRKLFIMKTKHASTIPVQEDEVAEEEEHNDLIKKILEQYY